MKFRIIERLNRGKPYYQIQIKKGFFYYWKPVRDFARKLQQYYPVTPKHPGKYGDFISNFYELSQVEEEYKNIIKYAYKFKNKEHIKKDKIITTVDLNNKKEAFVEIL